jgi:hypothetical protein
MLRTRLKFSDISMPVRNFRIMRRFLKHIERIWGRVTEIPETVKTFTTAILLYTIYTTGVAAK